MPSEAPQAAMRAERCGYDWLGGRALQLRRVRGPIYKLPFGKLHIWEVDTWEVLPLESTFLFTKNLWSSIITISLKSNY